MVPFWDPLRPRTKKCLHIYLSYRITYLRYVPPHLSPYSRPIRAGPATGYERSAPSTPQNPIYSDDRHASDVCSITRTSNPYSRFEPARHHHLWSSRIDHRWWRALAATRAPVAMSRTWYYYCMLIFFLLLTTCSSCFLIYDVTTIRYVTIIFIVLLVLGYCSM